MAKQSSSDEISINDGWLLYRSSPGGASKPDELDRNEPWLNAVVPGTVAATIFDKDANPHQPTVDIDDYDWWYETTFAGDDKPGGAAGLRFEGLATEAEVWLNGKPVHQSQNMFREFKIDITELLESENRLSIAFRSLTAAHKVKRGRPRWKTNLVNNQRLRWMRTTLLGRIPGWTPPIRPVGPWRDVTLERTQTFEKNTALVVASRKNGLSTLAVNLKLTDVGKNLAVNSATLSILGQNHDLDVNKSAALIHITGSPEIEVEDLWWPSTHGLPHRHDYEVHVQTDAGSILVRSGTVGFREIEVNRDDGKVELSVNGQPIFLRGGCWSSNDIVSLLGNPQALEQKLRLIRDAGANMVRVAGTMVYESDYFYDLCDQLGLMVWQDFMLANMDYPTDDQGFADDLNAEIRFQLGRIGSHPSATVFCGNSEVEQQAAMFGMKQATWVNSLYYETIPDIIREMRCSAVYFASSPCEGALPFHNSSGIAHYFGVGAYKQSFSDLQRAAVKLASECLAFSNIPDDRALKKHFGSVTPATHTPKWKAGVPRDSSTGWDFEDIRDHYIAELYELDPVALRYTDNGKYLAISQLVTGEIMQHVFNHWRDHEDACSGGLIWWLNDIVPGAGWGLLDSDGDPKPLFNFLRRCWATVTLSIEDCGLDGLQIRAVNESSEPRNGKVCVKILQHAKQCIASESTEMVIAANSTTRLSVDKLLARFMDTSYHYRFGPPKHDLVVATFDDGSGGNPLLATYYPGSRNLGALDRPEISVQRDAVDDQVRLRLRSSAFLHGVKLQSPAFDFDDNYFDLPPDTDWQIVAKPRTEPATVFRGSLSALNIEHPLPIK